MMAGGTFYPARVIAEAPIRDLIRPRPRGLPSYVLIAGVLQETARAYRARKALTDAGPIRLEVGVLADAGAHWIALRLSWEGGRGFVILREPADAAPVVEAPEICQIEIYPSTTPAGW